MSQNESTQTIYAVNSGSYSDYRIVALFSSREKAEAYMRAVPGGDYNGIETYELDPPVADLIARGYQVWTVFMLRDGTVERTPSGSIGGYDVGQADSAHIWRRSTAPAYRGKNVPDVLQSYVWAKSAEHAVKATNEKRLAMIATGKWDAKGVPADA